MLASRAVSSRLMPTHVPTSWSRTGQQRSISLLHHRLVASLENPQRQDDLKYAVNMVRGHDPVGYLPGLLLPTREMQMGYYAVRSFWVETGFRLKPTTPLPITASPQEHLEWWKQGVQDLFNDKEKNDDHPTLRLLQDLLQRHDLSKSYFDNVISGREEDLDLKQYPTLDSLINHTSLSCGSLLQLVLQCGDISSSVAFDVAKSVGKCHGLTNALRTSIPVISTTGKLIVPQDLCEKYGVRSPRYLLSALGQGDAECRAAFHNSIRDIVEVAREQLNEAREYRHALLSESPDAVSVMLPGLASETFLDRLEEAGYDLTDKNLRSAGIIEHATCASRMISAYYQETY